MKYQYGDFGYWWTVIENREDIEGGHWPFSIDCSKQKLLTLKGAPNTVSGNFDCSKNRLGSLEGGPSLVGRNFDCSSNKLNSLEYSPILPEGSFLAYDNQLTSLWGMHKNIRLDFRCDNNPKLSSLEEAPEYVGGDFHCHNCSLTSLVGGPKTVMGDMTCFSNKLSSLEGAPDYVMGNFNCSGNSFTTLLHLPTIQKDCYCQVISNSPVPVHKHKIVVSSDKNFAEYSKVGGTFYCDIPALRKYFPSGAFLVCGEWT